MLYEIKFLDPETEIFLSADPQLYEAKTEIDALRKFASNRKEDPEIKGLSIVSEDPFLLKIKGWTEAEDHSKFIITEDTFEYIAVEVKQ